MKKTYKNISKKDLVIPNVGKVKAGEKVKVDFELKNKNFEEVIEKDIDNKNIKLENKKHNL